MALRNEGTPDPLHFTYSSFLSYLLDVLELGYKRAVHFFRWWTAETPLGLGFAVVTVFLGFFYETVINLRARYDAALMRQASEAETAPGWYWNYCQSCCTPLQSREYHNLRLLRLSGSFKRRPSPSAQSVVRSSLFAFSNFYSLFLMMIFMTYNAYLYCFGFGGRTGHFGRLYSFLKLIHLTVHDLVAIKMCWAVW